MSDVILSFDEISAEAACFAGGKGGSLARLYQAGFPVPAGFVILPSAFDSEGLNPQAWSGYTGRLACLREGEPDISFAVRSLAPLSEDSANTSFAGEFETVLNVQSDTDIHKAVLTVYHSRMSERVQAYSLAKGIDTDREIAVVVEQLVRADSSGVGLPPTRSPASAVRPCSPRPGDWGRRSWAGW